MPSFDRSPRRTTSALLLSVVLAGCAFGESNTAPDLPQRIENAITRADHDAPALSYDREAAIARDKAAEHRRMAKACIGARAGACLQAHCNVVARNYESLATEYEGLAADHRKVAAQANP